MYFFIFGIIFGLLATLSAVLYKTYGYLPAKELKRQARKGDELAAILYRSVAYGFNAQIILALFGLICLYFAFALLEKAVGVWLTLPTLLVLGVFGLYFVRSKGGMHPASTWLAVKVSPLLAWLAERLHPVLDAISRFVKRFLPIRVHSGLYEKEDFVRLLEQQRTQPDSRISAGEIDLLTHALSFGDKTVADAMVPKRVVVDVNVADSVGPVLMGELHRSGHSRFPVYESRHDHLVGVLYLHDLVEIKHTGMVRDIMRPKVMYVHENFTLYQTLQAFVKTKQHLFVVVNEFEEYVGIITIEDVLERVIGKLIVDEFDTYDDLRAVAAVAARKERDHKDKKGIDAAHHTDTSAVPPPHNSSESTEVVQ